MKQIRIWVEIDSVTRDLPSISLLVGTPCDPEISVQQGQRDRVRGTAMPKSRWRIGAEIEAHHLADDVVGELIGRLSKWKDLAPAVRAELAPWFRILIYHDQVECSVSLSAEALREIADAGFELSVEVCQTTWDEEEE